MKTTSFAALLLSLSTAACTSSGSFGDTASNVEGVYHVTSYTRNDDGCAPGGDSQLGSDTFAVARHQKVFGFDFLMVMSCASAADCHDKLAKLDAGQAVSGQFGYTLETADGDDTLLGTVAESGFSESGGVCSGGELQETTLVLDGAALRIETQVTYAADYAVDKDGFCTTDAVQEATAGKACSAFELMTADFVEGL